PARSTIGRLVNAVAPGGALPIVRFPSSDPYDIRICRIDSDVANRYGGLTVEHVLPGIATVQRLEKSPRCCGGVEDRRLVGVDGKTDDAAAHQCGPDCSRPEITEQ